MPYIFILIFALIAFIFPSLDIFAQDTQQKQQDLIAALAKTKYKKKEQKGFSFELYVDIKSEAVLKNNVRDYAGVYETEGGGYRLELRVSPDGKVEGSGRNSNFLNSRNQSFTLGNALIEGALLTGTKIYADGRTQSFEAVFNNRTIVAGKNPNEINSRETKYGLGFVEYGDSPDSGITNRIFLEFKF